MLFPDLLMLSLRNYRTKTARTLITILGIGVGVGTIVLLVSLGYGLQNLLLSQITTAESLLTLDVYTPDPQNVFLDNKLVEDIKKVENVVEISPLANFTAQAVIGEMIANSSVYGISSSFYRLAGVKPLVGRLPQKETEVACSSALLKLFNLEPAKILNEKIDFLILEETQNAEGLPEIQAYEKKGFTVVGVVDDEATPFSYIFLNAMPDVPIAKYDSIKVKVANTNVLESVKKQIVDLGYLTSSLSETVEEANRIFRTLQIVLAVFGLAALIVAAIGMFNTMTVTLLERTNEIGIMKAIGASGKEISGLFLLEATAMGFSGSLAGLAIAFVASKIFNLLLNLMAGLYGAQGVNIFYTPIWFILIVIGFTTVVGFLTAVYPARVAAKYDPLEALRYK